MNSLNKCYRLVYYPYILLMTVDNFITMLYETLTMNFDGIVEDMDSNKTIKRILKGKQILMYLFWFTTLSLIFGNIDMNKSVNKDLFSDWLKDYITLTLKRNLIYILIMLLVMLSICVVTIYLKDSGVINKHEEMEAHIVIYQKEIKNNICHSCNIIRVVRSYHCELCGHCVSKYEIHSRWFHKDIGSNNCFIYCMFLLYCNIFYLYSVFIFYLGINYFNDFDSKELIATVWMYLMIYVEVKLLFFSKTFYSNIFSNLTWFESINLSRLPYTWANFRREFFNPFDKGCYYNFQEVVYSFINPSISEISNEKSSYKRLELQTFEDTNHHLKLEDNDPEAKLEEETKENKQIDGDNQIEIKSPDLPEVVTDKTDIIQNGSELGNHNNDHDHNHHQHSNKEEHSHGSGCSCHMVGEEPKFALPYNVIKNINYVNTGEVLVSEKSDSIFITKDRKLYHEKYTGKTSQLVNWTKIRLYSVMDIENSPMKYIIQEQIKLNMRSTNQFS